MRTGPTGARGERDAEDGGRLVRQHGAALGVPPRVGVGAGDEVVADLFDPLRAHRGDDPGPQPVGLDELAGHHRAGRALRERRTPGDHEPGVAGGAVLGGVAVLHPDVGQQPRQQCPMDRVGMGGLAVAGQAQVLADALQLGVQVLPFAHPQVVDELAAAQAPEPAGRTRPTFGLEVLPQMQVGEEVRVGVPEAGMQLIGLLAVLGRAVARILDRHGRHDDLHLPQAALVCCGSMRPRRGSMGRRASCRPTGVSQRRVPTGLSASTAPSSSNSAMP